VEPLTFAVVDNRYVIACTTTFGNIGDCIIEFVVDENSWYPNGHANPGTDSCHPEWNQDIVKAENVGSFYD